MSRVLNLAELPPPTEPWEALAEAARPFRRRAREDDHARYIAELLDGRASDARILRALVGFELEDRLDCMQRTPPRETCCICAAELVGG